MARRARAFCEPSGRRPLGVSLAWPTARFSSEEVAVTRVADTKSWPSPPRSEEPPRSEAARLLTPRSLSTMCGGIGASALQAASRALWRVGVALHAVAGAAEAPLRRVVRDAAATQLFGQRKLAVQEERAAGVGADVPHAPPCARRGGLGARGGVSSSGDASRRLLNRKAWTRASLHWHEAWRTALQHSKPSSVPLSPGTCWIQHSRTKSVLRIGH